jgi:hypothetical protein
MDYRNILIRLNLIREGEFSSSEFSRCLSFFLSFFLSFLLGKPNSALGRSGRYINADEQIHGTEG